MAELEKTCENCKYLLEDNTDYDSPCWNCIHNATEHFEAKELSEYDKALDDLSDAILDKLQKYAIENTLEANIDNAKISFGFIKKKISVSIEELKKGSK